jgi:hypothetical protein
MTSCSANDDNPIDIEGNVPCVGNVMGKEFGELTSAEVGWVIALDGKVYKNPDAATAAGTEAVAMLAYINDRIYYQSIFGQAIQLTCSEEMNWNEANEYVKSLPEIKHATWSLPSMDFWTNIVKGCAIDGDLKTVTEQKMTPINGFKTKFEATGAKWQNGWYWTMKQEGTDQAYLVSADIVGTQLPQLVIGNPAPKTYPYAVRACLWFGVTKKIQQ